MTAWKTIWQLEKLISETWFFEFFFWEIASESCYEVWIAGRGFVAIGRDGQTCENQPCLFEQLRQVREGLKGRLIIKEWLKRTERLLMCSYIE